jgi:hypothetical protein
MVEIAIDLSIVILAIGIMEFTLFIQVFAIAMAVLKIFIQGFMIFIAVFIYFILVLMVLFKVIIMGIVIIRVVIAIIIVYLHFLISIYLNSIRLMVITQIKFSLFVFLNIISPLVGLLMNFIEQFTAYHFIIVHLSTLASQLVNFIVHSEHL